MVRKSTVSSTVSSTARQHRLSHRKGASRLLKADETGTNKGLPEGMAHLSTALKGGLNAPKPHEAAAYVLDMALVLRNIANDSGLNFLAYLLDMAAEEADGLLRQKHKAAASSQREARAGR